MSEIDKGVSVEKTVTMGETYYRALVAERDRLLEQMKGMVPIHSDDSWVFVDGTGDVELDHGGKMRAERDRLRRALLHIADGLSSDPPKLSRAMAASTARTALRDAPQKKSVDLKWLHDMSDEDIELVRQYLPEDLRARLAAALGEAPQMKPRCAMTTVGWAIPDDHPLCGICGRGRCTQGNKP